MIRYLIQRPIAVLMSFIALVIAGLVLIGKVPISLLPNIDVPQIVVRVNYPNTAAGVMEENIIKPIRENLANLNGLKNVESRSANHTGLLYLTFEYGTRMDLSYIEVNEKLDRLTNSFPRDMERPQVIRVNTSDIPVIRLQVIPKENITYLETSLLCEKVLRKRLEQIEGVSLVDMNGYQKEVITVEPDEAALNALNLDRSIIAQTIENANQYLGGLSIKDGQYRYFVKLANTLDETHDIAQLPIKTKDGTVIPLSRLAIVKQEIEKQTGYHLFNGKEGVVITIQKQPDSRMNELTPKIKEAVKQFSQDYPQVNFSLTQDQTFLLDAGISNLYQDLLYGGALTVLLLFMFLGNWASPVLMSISIPLSLIITFIFFYLFNISFNIISLSGLALGIGMLIDNSIVVIDNITRRRREGLSMMESSVEGTNEVVAPVISQVLTTVAVYAPLVLLSGMAGALVYDQSIALTISLGVSLMVAFVLAPLLYKMFLKRPPELLKEDTVFYQWVARGYHKMIHHILKHKFIYFLITIFLMPLGLLFATKIPVSSLPKIEKKESLLLIDWNSSIDASENLKRIKSLLSAFRKNCIVTEAEIGIKQFLLQQENNGIERAELYFECSDEATKLSTDEKVKKWMKASFPTASLQIIDAPNAFTQLFTSSKPYIEVKFKPSANVSSPHAYDKLVAILAKNPYQYFNQGAGMIIEPNISIMLDYEKMTLYGIERTTVENTLQQLFGTFTITQLKRFGDIKNIRLGTDRITTEDKLRTTVKSVAGIEYPLNQFISVSYEEQQKFITADKTGEYRSITYEEITDKNVQKLQQSVSATALANGFSVDFSGRYFENKEQLNKLWIIFLVVLFLLYFILAIQYENLMLPLIVMLTIPLGITGGMFLLWITGGTLDVMAAIGFIVILGLIVDDPILKVETLARIEKKYRQSGVVASDKMLEEMIHEAGDICLKPLLMVSLTTSIAMVPVLLVGGIGNDLQKPLAIVIIGGLTIGTFFTTWFIPLAYWYITKWMNKRRKQKIAGDIIS